MAVTEQQYLEFRTSSSFLHEEPKSEGNQSSDGRGNKQRSVRVGAWGRRLLCCYLLDGIGQQNNHGHDSEEHLHCLHCNRKKMLLPEEIRE